MRTREEIERKAGSEYVGVRAAHGRVLLILEVLLDIRDLLTSKKPE